MRNVIIEVGKNFLWGTAPVGAFVTVVALMALSVEFRIAVFGFIFGAFITLLGWALREIGRP